MTDTARMTFFGRIVAAIKAKLLFVVKLVYVLPFFIFGLWLLSQVYFPDIDLNASILLPNYGDSDDRSPIFAPKNEAVPRGHFHMTDAYVEQREPNPPICVTCHGTYAHGKDKKIRALLNMHTGFIACSVCHARQDLNGAEAQAGPRKDRIDFQWVMHDTGEIRNRVTGEYGKYPATIYPIRFTAEGPRRIFTPIKADAAQRFLKMRPDLTPDQVAQAKAKLHAPLSEKAVACADCHRVNGYLDFRKLGFPKTRVDHLVSSEIVGMLDKYKTFHLPEVIDFRTERTFQ